jgi:hypothetical protein
MSDQVLQKCLIFENEEEIKFLYYLLEDYRYLVEGYCSHYSHNRVKNLMKKVLNVWDERLAQIVDIDSVGADAKDGPYTYLVG